MMSDPVMKPCPFCGNTPDPTDDRYFIQDQGYKWGHVNCCGFGEVRTGYQELEHWRDDAIKGWNNRPIEDELNRRIESLEATDREAPRWARDTIDALNEQLDTKQQELEQALTNVRHWKENTGKVEAKREAAEAKLAAVEGLPNTIYARCDCEHCCRIADELQAVLSVRWSFRFVRDALEGDNDGKA